MFWTWLETFWSGVRIGPLLTNPILKNQKQILSVQRKGSIGSCVVGVGFTKRSLFARPLDFSARPIKKLASPGFDWLWMLSSRMEWSRFRAIPSVTPEHQATENWNH
jgi:hypothetical protein